METKDKPQTGKSIVTNMSDVRLTLLNCKELEINRKKINTVVEKLTKDIDTGYRRKWKWYLDIFKDV
jgi:hypothetical protein